MKTPVAETLRWLVVEENGKKKVIDKRPKDEITLGLVEELAELVK